MERYEVDRLASYVRSRLAGRVQNLRLRLRENGIVLQGRSRSYLAKALAQQFVAENTSVPVKANEITVP